MNLFKVESAFIILVLFVSCAKEGKPSKQGQLLTLEQIKSLEKDQSWNGKLVEIEGYPAFCGMFANVRLGEKNKMEIRTEQGCKGEKLIEANLEFGGDKVLLFGEKERNVVLAYENFSNETLKFCTDDYQELPTGKLKFSGTLIYINNTYYLDNVTIHK
ncbi:hypothetical protein HYN56_04460 [Flavobacterium crocinum]|uniref:Uncharacterized protein n=1 Tax=Flavobacterium crocinum TaxID=2183896 RepID=A0A2S1YHH9_9FLAO|nr:hypothetical protein [Flavobacterium crocinum]AWK03513.1 hypothetical protein HYN56_04460 [Flavobacterium crocinum]